MTDIQTRHYSLFYNKKITPYTTLRAVHRASWGGRCSPAVGTSATAGHGNGGPIEERERAQALDHANTHFRRGIRGIEHPIEVMKSVDLLAGLLVDGREAPEVAFVASLRSLCRLAEGNPFACGDALVAHFRIADESDLEHVTHALCRKQAESAVESGAVIGNELSIRSVNPQVKLLVGLIETARVVDVDIALNKRPAHLTTRRTAPETELAVKRTEKGGRSRPRLTNDDD